MIMNTGIQHAHKEIFMKNPIWDNIYGERAESEKENYIEILSKIPMFSKLNNKSLDLVEHIMHKRKYEKGEYIIKQGNPGVGMFIIERGSVGVTIMDELGNETQIATGSDGVSYGEIALLDDTPRTASVKALTTCNVLIFFRPDLFELMEKKPKIGASILYELGKFLIARIDKVKNQIVEKRKNQQ